MLSPAEIAVSGESRPTVAVFEQSVAAIDAAYQRLGHRLGWRFLTTPRATLSPGVRIGLITLNPGGDHEPADHPRASCERGNAYVSEQWPGHERGAAPLQRQVRCLAEGLWRHLGMALPLSRFMNEEIMTGYFIPFRSPRWADLANRRESMAFAAALWSRILPWWQPRLLLTIDREAFAAIHDLLVKGQGLRVRERRVFETGWGAYQAEAVRLDNGNGLGRITLARLPHLSTFKLFSRPDCRPYLEQFLGYVTEELLQEEPAAGVNR